MKADSTKEEDEAIPPMVWKESPEMSANFFSGILYFWLQPLFTRASFLKSKGKALEAEDLVPLPSIDQSKSIEIKFTESYKKYKESVKRNEEQVKQGSTKQVADIEVERKKKLESQLTYSLLAVCKQRLITAGIIKFFNTSLQFTFPILLNNILKFFEQYQSGAIPSDAPGHVKYRGYWLSCLLFFFISCKALTEGAYFHKVNRCAWQIKAAVSSSIYSKALRLASSEQQKTTLGEMVNLMQVDASKLEAFIPQIHVLWDGVFQIAGYMTILGFLLGWPCVIGLILMCCAGPVMGFIMGKLFGINRKMVKFTDERVKTVNEALQGIRCVKMYTWEENFLRVVGESRDQELDSLKSVAYLRGFSRAYMTCLPPLAAVVTFIAYAYGTSQPITASTLFAALVAFDQLRFPLMFYPMAMAQYAQAKVSLGRVAIFLGYSDLTSEGYKRDNITGTGEIHIENANIYWSDPSIPLEVGDISDDKSIDKSEHTKSDQSTESMIYPKAVVTNISLSVTNGSLCAVIGRVGSGKSSLCSAILNEAVLGQGSSVLLRGKVAYVAQSAWIMNTSVRNNILFGLPYEEARYQEVLQVCQLTHDLEMLEDGDMTEIGEKGINLSGGQKQRVSVARAAYSNADVIIFDDPLSALDPEVALKLFDECIIGFLNGKTRLLVTNQLQCLSKCDMIVALGKRGIVLEQGTYEDLIQGEGEVQRLLQDLDETSKKAQSKEVEGIKALATTSVPKMLEAAAKQVANPEKEEVKSLVTKEEREVGAVKFQVYSRYIKAGGGILRFLFVLTIFVISTGMNLVRDVWISLWTSDTNFVRFSKGFYLGGYGGFAMLVGVITFFRSYFLAVFGIHASKTLHMNLITSVFRAPMSFFDTTPTGRILSRFSKDMFSMDQELTESIDFVLFMALSLIFSMATIAFATPWFALLFLPLAFIYIRILNYFRSVSRETKRLESLSRSPVFTHFSETLGGLSTIRAYGESTNFLNDFESKLDLSTQAAYCNKTGDRWLSTRLEMIGASIAGFAALLATQIVVSNGVSGVGQNSSYSSLAGLSLTYAIQITGMLQWVVRSFAQVEAAMNSVERILYYSEQIEKEAAMDSSDLEKSAKQDPSLNPATKAVTASGGKVEEVPPQWPSKGMIQLTNLRMRYRSSTPLVIKGLNVHIEGGQRIGVVGRTGSGKSSLLLCLMRLVEPEIDDDSVGYKAPIRIDGVDVMRIGLKVLRSAISIIPQNPVLFSGTIRSNLDPFEEYSDEQIWLALEKCGMKHTVMDIPNCLLAVVAEYGENLSQGQRQLLCLGRALLKQSRVLLLDEATSSVDFETDHEIQRTLREAFPGCTVLTIAHRVNTIMDSDKILVMKDGVAVEFASPKELLADEDSLFSEIVRHSETESRS